MASPSVTTTHQAGLKRACLSVWEVVAQSVANIAPTAAPALIVPSTALIVRASGTQVAVLDSTQAGQSATARFVPVTVGRDFGGTVEIQSGLTDGQSVVQNPGADLVDGMRVRIAPSSGSAVRAAAAAAR